MESRVKTVERVLAVGGVGLLIVGCLLVLRPFLVALMWAIVLAYTIWPVHVRILKLVGGRRTLASLFTCSLLVILLLVPFLLMGLTMASEARGLVNSVREAVVEGLPKPPEVINKVPVVGERIYESWQELRVDQARLSQLVQRWMEPVGKFLLGLGVVVARGLVQIALSIFITFFLLKYGEGLSAWALALIRGVTGGIGSRLLQVAGDTVRAVVYGILGTAVVQGVLAGIGFLIAGVPAAGLLALGTFLLSPAGGPPLIWLPVSIWLMKNASFGWGLFMLIWGIMVSTVDNLVRPWLISQGSKMPFILIFFGLVGGVLAFGFIGVFLGPTLLSVGYRVIQDWLIARSALDPRSDASSK